MTVRFNHMMIAAHDRHSSATFFTEVFGLREPDDSGMFAVMRLADDELLLSAEPGIDFPGQHYAFLVDDETFDELLARLRERGIEYWADPQGRLTNQINTNHGGRGVYFDDPAATTSKRSPAHTPAPRRRKLRLRLSSRAHRQVLALLAHMRPFSPNGALGRRNGQSAPR